MLRPRPTAQGLAPTSNAATASLLSHFNPETIPATMRGWVALMTGGCHDDLRKSAGTFSFGGINVEDPIQLPHSLRPNEGR
jgi:hypothetical protein